MAFTVMAYRGMAYILMAYIVMACIGMAYMRMAYLVMAYIVMARIVKVYILYVVVVPEETIHHTLHTAHQRSCTIQYMRQAPCVRNQSISTLTGQQTCRCTCPCTCLHTHLCTVNPQQQLATKPRNSILRSI